MVYKSTYFSFWLFLYHCITRYFDNILLYKCSNFLTVRINGIKIVFALLVFALLSKHSIKIVKNYGKDYNNYPLTKIYSMNFNNERIKKFSL